MVGRRCASLLSIVHIFWSTAYQVGLQAFTTWSCPDLCFSVSHCVTFVVVNNAAAIDIVVPAKEPARLIPSIVSRES